MYESINPTNAEKIRTFESTSNQDLLNIIEKAKKAQSTWRKIKIEEKLKYVAKLKELITSNSSELAKEITLEMGKTYKDALKEIQRMELFCLHALERSPEILQSKEIKNPLTTATMHYEALGIIFSITPWNVPMATPLRSTLPALLCGNAVILKPAPNVAGCALKLFELIKEAGFPEDIAHPVLLKNDQAEKLIADSRIRKVSFVGSTLAGAHLAGIAGNNIKPILLELGGSDPMIILNDADLNLAVQDAAAARCGNAGQVCCSSKRMIVEESIYDQFKSAFIEVMKNKKTGDPFNDATDYGPLARKDILDRLKEQVNKMKNTNAKVILDTTPNNSTGYFFSPMIFEDLAENSITKEEEFFGPVATIFKAKDQNDALKIANSSSYGLGSAVYTSSQERANFIAENIEAGFIYINRPPGLHPYIPFGGVKNSGYGKDCGDEGYYEFVNKKVVVGSID